MNHEEEKLKNSKRRHRDEVAVKRQVRIAKEHHLTELGKFLENAHKYHKRHAMDCGNPQCYLCGNPRKTHKDKLTQQEKRLFQDIDTPNDKHSNGLRPAEDE
jgi:hypothetical protein